jgi:hypothetical protein
MSVEGIPQRDVVVTFARHYASYTPGEDACFTPEEAQHLADLGVAGPADGPPLNFTVPYVYQEGAVLTCTMGEWTGMPTGYAYAWQLDGAPIGTDAPTYDRQLGDVGHVATCVVTASNAAGAAAAPPSNAVTIT